MTERRYTDDEVAEIFRAAAEDPHTSLPEPQPDGLTLADLQAIGRDVGIAPEAVARAAQVVAVRRGAVSRTLLGLPIGVERRVHLGRRLTDDEWEHLVVELRDVFHARGRLRVDGSLRQWTNGNLYVLLEPTPAGDRLRLGSVHGGATASIHLGLVIAAVGTVMSLANLVTGQAVDPGTLTVLLAGGATLFANGALRLPRWARLRAQQMESLAAQLALPTDTRPPGSPPLPGGERPPDSRPKED